MIDPYHRLCGHPGITVVDGSAVCANVGVNPALTITAQAERAMSLWPSKGGADLRPAQGEPYGPSRRSNRFVPLCLRPPSRPSAFRICLHPPPGRRRPTPGALRSPRSDARRSCV
ncbi:hypothetical protein [Micromonospora chersina]